MLDASKNGTHIKGWVLNDLLRTADGEKVDSHLAATAGCMNDGDLSAFIKVEPWYYKP